LKPLIFLPLITKLMFNLRSLLLFSTLAILGLFIVQNLSTVLPLIIFGVRTPALPLGVWVLIAIVLGFISSLFLQLPSSFPSSRPRQSQRENLQESYSEEFVEEASNRQNRDDRSQGYRGGSSQGERRSNPEISPDVSDWDLDFGDDWQDEPRPVNPPPRNTPPESEVYAPKQAPVVPPRTPAPYGMGDQDKSEGNKVAGEKTEIGKSGVGRTEAVYDANYRVINAPFSPPPRVAKAQEEDWGLEEEDDSVFDFPDMVEAKDSPVGDKKPGS